MGRSKDGRFKKKWGNCLEMKLRPYCKQCDWLPEIRNAQGHTGATRFREATPPLMDNPPSCILLEMSVAGKLRLRSKRCI